MRDSFRCRTALSVTDHSVQMANLRALERRGQRVNHLPYSLRVLLENLLRHEDGQMVTAQDIENLLRWNPSAQPSVEIPFVPARVLMQDFTGVPAVVDLASMRDAMRRMGGDPTRVNPRQPVELVIDHSVQVDHFASTDAKRRNTEVEFARNKERYQFLRWGQQAFRNFRVVPPDTGIVHQVNVEYLARVVMLAEDWAFPDTVVGTDSHTTMVNGLGVLGWGVGGIEAEAAMLGQPVSMLIPQVVGVRLEGRLPQGATATDLVLRVTELLRKANVVGKFVEFFGPGLDDLPLADRATVANMAPEYGATCGFFPVDDTTIEYLRFSGRDEKQVRLVRTYMREQGLLRHGASPDPEYSEVLRLDLATIDACLAGPKRPQDRLPIAKVKSNFDSNLASLTPAKKSDPLVAAEQGRAQMVEVNGRRGQIEHGSVVIAAITSCTNTSNPWVMMAAGLVAKKAVARGLTSKPWVKTSLAPGSKVVTEYLTQAGLTPFLEQLGFYTVGYGCTTCIGNSGPLPPAVARGIETGNLVVASVLSGNRNFEGRVHPAVRANYLASPPLVVAYAIAGRVDFDPTSEPLGSDKSGKDVFLKDIWPTHEELQQAVGKYVTEEQFKRIYSQVFEGSEAWRALSVPAGDTYAWDADSTYVKRAPYFDGMGSEPEPFQEITGARVLAFLGDSITTDHISPAGSIKHGSPAAQWLMSKGVSSEDFNQYGARRGHDDVMVRGTFANVRLRNKLVPGVEGGETVLLPEKKPLSIFDASVAYRERRVPLILLAGKEYGSGSSRDWAAKGPYLLGVRAVIAESYERIHRSNLVGMGIVPLEFPAGQSAESLGLTGTETYDIFGLASAIDGNGNGGVGAERTATVRVTGASGRDQSFEARVRIDTPTERDYVRHGNILRYVLRKLLRT